MCPTTPEWQEARPNWHPRHVPPAQIGPEQSLRRSRAAIHNTKEYDMTTITFTETEPPQWLLAMWKEIDDKTFGKGFDCFAENAVCNLGVADWRGREVIRQSCASSSTRASPHATRSSHTWIALCSRSSTVRSR
jgi:hypothetical protein